MFRLVSAAPMWPKKSVSAALSSQLFQRNCDKLLLVCVFNAAVYIVAEQGFKNEMPRHSCYNNFILFSVPLKVNTVKMK